MSQIKSGALAARPSLVAETPQNPPDWEIYEEIMRVRAAVLGQPPQRNYRFEQYPYPQRSFVLSIMNRSHTLVEAGDIKKYFEIDDKINALPGKSMSKPDIAVRKMMEWLDNQMTAIRPHKTASKKEKVVITMLSWGTEFCDKTLKWAFRSMMAEGNLPALVKRKHVIMFVQTNEDGRDYLENSDIIWQMKAIGVQFQYALIPQDILDCINEGREELYWMVGAAASLALNYAKKAGAAFHHSYPDCLYSNNYFSELLRLSMQHKNIIHPTASADETTLFPMLAPYETDKAISVPAPDLMALTLNAVHLTLWTMMVNNRSANWQYPYNYVLLWESEDMLHVNSPHVNAAWISHDSIKDLPDRFLRTLDSELDMICKGYDFYLPQECDDIYMAGLCGQSRYSVNDMYVDEKECGKNIWRSVGHRDLMKFFFTGAKYRINRDIRPIPANAIPNAQIAAEKTYLFNALMATDPYSGAEFAQPRMDTSGVFASVK